MASKGTNKKTTKVVKEEVKEEINEPIVTEEVNPKKEVKEEYVTQKYTTQQAPAKEVKVEDPETKKRKGRRFTLKVIFLITVLSIATILLITFAFGYEFYDVLINPNSSKSFIFKNSKVKNSLNTYMEDKGDINLINQNWLSRIYFKEASVMTEDSIDVHGYVIESPTNSTTWIIAAHGFYGEAMDISEITNKFYMLGYNILIPDLRGHGGSSGNYIGMGLNDKYDIIAWINYINDNYQNSKIILYGISMGANAMMSASGENLPDNVKVIIADSGFTSLDKLIDYQLKENFILSSFPMVNIANIITKTKHGFNFSDVTVIEALKKTQVPTLFIHGSMNTFIPYSMVNELYTACANPDKELLIINGAGHGDTMTVDSKLYWDTVKGFIEKYAK